MTKARQPADGDGREGQPGGQRHARHQAEKAAGGSGLGKGDGGIHGLNFR